MFVRSLFRISPILEKYPYYSACSRFTRNFKKYVQRKEVFYRCYLNGIPILEKYPYYSARTRFTFDWRGNELGRIECYIKRGIFDGWHNGILNRIVSSLNVSSGTCVRFPNQCVRGPKPMCPWSKPIFRKQK
jgi:hypothetical protein